LLGGKDSTQKFLLSVPNMERTKLRRSARLFVTRLDPRGLRASYMESWHQRVSEITTIA